MCVNGHLRGVTVRLADLEEQSEVKLMLVGVEVFGNIITDYIETQDRWNIVLR